jgi:hypothetical protein
VPLHPERPATLVAVNGDALDIRHLDGTTGTTTVAAPDLLADVLAHDDLCRLHGQALLLVNTHYRVLGIATGPAAPPSRLEVMWASRLENGAVVELSSGNTETTRLAHALDHRSLTNRAARTQQRSPWPRGAGNGASRCLTTLSPVA